MVIKDRSVVFRAVIFVKLTKSFQGPQKIPKYRGLQGWLSFSLALVRML